MKTLVAVIASFALMLTQVALGQDAVMFNYQGKVKVGGQPFNATGNFKFAILNTSGTVTLWSNDGTSTDAQEPQAALSIPVSEGVFNVMIGDPTAGMQGINSTIFNSRTPLRLRTWFNDGTHGFEQLRPDSVLVDLTLQTISTGKGDFTVYVNGASGDDANNGLSPDKAKKTIQSAVDTLPSQLRCNVTIDIADGIYREEVTLSGLGIAFGKSLTFVGDESWTPSSATDPKVRITGADVDAPTPIKKRGNCFVASQCDGVVLRGILFDYATGTGAALINGTYKIYNCKACNCNWGIIGRSQADVYMEGCVASQNFNHGLYLARNSFGILSSCKATNNSHSGVYADSQCSLSFTGSGDFSNNAVTGATACNFSTIGANGLTAQFRNNGQYGLSAQGYSFLSGFGSSGVTISGNPSGSIQTATGSSSY